MNPSAIREIAIQTLRYYFLFISSSESFLGHKMDHAKSEVRHGQNDGMFKIRGSCHQIAKAAQLMCLVWFHTCLDLPLFLLLKIAEHCRVLAHTNGVECCPTRSETEHTTFFCPKCLGRLVSPPPQIIHFRFDACFPKSKIVNNEPRTLSST
jgi:hypothetical protein